MNCHLSFLFHFFFCFFFLLLCYHFHCQVQVHIFTYFSLLNFIQSFNVSNHDVILKNILGLPTVDFVSVCIFKIPKNFMLVKLHDVHPCGEGAYITGKVTIAMSS